MSERYKPELTSDLLAPVMQSAYDMGYRHALQKIAFEVWDERTNPGRTKSDDYYKALEDIERSIERKIRKV